MWTLIGMPQRPINWYRYQSSFVFVNFVTSTWDPKNKYFIQLIQYKTITYIDSIPGNLFLPVTLAANATKMQHKRKAEM